MSLIKVVRYAPVMTKIQLRSTHMYLILTENKTRETRVLSRPAICWIHYVQIAPSISAKHLSQAPQQCSKMLSNAYQCSAMLRNSQQCSAMLSGAKKCSRVLKFNILAL